MTNRQQIEAAFAHRERPAFVTDIATLSTLREDALHFVGKDWRDITAEEWNAFSDAYFGFNPIAFMYYLPSILVLSLPDLKQGPVVTGSLLYTLDTSGIPEFWDDFLTERFINLTDKEFESLDSWINHHLMQTNENHDQLERAHETIILLHILAQEREASRQG